MKQKQTHWLAGIGFYKQDAQPVIYPAALNR